MLIVADTVTAVVVVNAEKRLARIPEAHLHVASTAPAAEVSVLKQVQHGLAARRETPVVPFPLLVPLCSWNLGMHTHNEY